MWKGIKFYILVALFFNCQKPVTIAYETAIDSCKPDTIRQNIGTGVMETYTYKSDCLIGAQLPDFSAKTIKGEDINADYFEGHISVINFWFIGCHPCEAEIPGFNKLVEKYSSSPVKFLAIGRDNPEDIQQFISEHPFDVDHVGYGEAIIQTVFKMKWGFPFTIVADQHQKIINVLIGGKTDSTAVQLIQNDLIPVIDKALKDI